LSDSPILNAELTQDICPPREVRNFRVLIVKDARTQRRPSHRRAQITVWDVLSLLLSEGCEGGNFHEGQRFKVTNLMPTQQGAWMDRDKGSEVYLCTRRDSRWIKIR
jgi:breast cancer 2 susceptibility protein